MDVGTEIKNLRQLRGLTQTELALRADVHRLTILRIENHHPHEMRFDMIDKIFRALGMQLKLEPVDLSARPTPDATTSTDSTV